MGGFAGLERSEWEKSINHNCSDFTFSGFEKHDFEQHSESLKLI